MKNDQYIPHEVSTRSCSQVINLIEAEGAAGYGFYWAVLEYLRAQPHYTGDVRAIKNIARQMKVRSDKALRVLNNYGLFVVDHLVFYSPMLVEKMLPLERKRAKVCTENAQNVSETLSNPLEISNPPLKEEKRREEKRISSSKKKDDDARTEPWESYINSLREEDQWKEIMAMRSGIGKEFIRRFDDVLQHFKQHVQAVANESRIVSPAEAKKYFCFYLTPGSATYQKLMAHLKQTEAPDRMFILDPYNCLEHQIPSGQSETQYINEFLEKLRNFARKKQVLVVLAAHPVKMKKDVASGKFPVPTMYDISGSAAFFNKADFGIAIERDRTQGITRIHVQKVKFRHLGQPGVAAFIFNMVCGRFVSIIESHTPDLPNSNPVWDNSNWLARKLDALAVQGELELDVSSC